MMARRTGRITSVANERIKDLVRLRKRRERDERGVVIIEEPLVIGRALDESYPLRTLFFCPEQVPLTDRPLLDRLLALPDLEAVELAPPVMAKAAYRDQPQGLLVLADQVRHRLADIPTAGSPLIVVLEGIEKPGNLGAVQRIADGAGAAAVIVCGGGTDPFNPNVLRASRGACFAVPTVTADTAELLEWLARAGIATVATSPAAVDSWDEVDLTGPVAMFLGTEHDGLGPELLQAAGRTVAIPMLGRGDSLNVSTSAAILLYEAVRQRRAAGKP